MELVVVGGRELGDPVVRDHDVRLGRHGALAEEALGVEVGALGVVHAAAAVGVVLDEPHAVHEAGLAQRLTHAALHKVAVALVVHERDVHPARNESIRQLSFPLYKSHLSCTHTFSATVAPASVGSAKPPMARRPTAARKELLSREASILVVLFSCLLPP